MLYSHEKNICGLKNIDLDIANVKNEYRGVNPISYDEKTSSSNSFSSVVESEVIDREEKLQRLEMCKLKKFTEVTKLQNALEALKEKELKIIKLKYYDELTDDVIGKRFYLTGTRIYQIRKDIIIKLIEMLNLRST